MYVKDASSLFFRNFNSIFQKHYFALDIVILLENLLLLKITMGSTVLQQKYLLKLMYLGGFRL